MPTVSRSRKSSSAAHTRDEFLAPRIDGESLHFEPGFSVTFERTLRIPDDGKTYPLPPGLGNFPIRAIDPTNKRIPKPMRERDGFMIPMYQREALWVYFQGQTCAVQIGVGGVNAISGRQWRERLTKRPQNYLVAPDQRWLDGINAGKGFIRQFVAMPLGKGYTVEEQVTGKAKFGGMQVRVVRPKPGKIECEYTGAMLMCAELSMGLAAGGKMKQQIDKDEYGIDTWDPKMVSEAFIHIVNSEQWTAMTGEPMPSSPIDAATYTQFGLPWFDLYRDDTPAVGPSGILAGVETVKGIDEKKRLPAQDGDETVPIPGKQVTLLGDEDWPKS